MSVFDDPRGKLQWLEDELLEEEFDEDECETEPPCHHRNRKVRWAEPESMAAREAIYVEKKKQEKGIRRLKFLAFLETLAILSIIWGWIKWLY